MKPQTSRAASNVVRNGDIVFKWGNLQKSWTQYKASGWDSTLTLKYSNHSHGSFCVHKIPPWKPPSDAVNKRGQTTAPSFPLPASAPPVTQLAHKSRTPSSASLWTTIAKTASTPPAPGTPAHSTPGRADVAFTSFVWTGGSMGTPAFWNGSGKTWGHDG